MRSKMINRSGYGQLRWVILLLAVAVILPTVCLLWFMSQAIKNERLAIKEKLIGEYENRIKESVREHLYDDWLNLNISAISASDGFLVYGSDNKLTFPVDDVYEDISHDDRFSHAFELEYAVNDPAAAIVEYRRIADTANTDTLRIMADISQARCLSKLKSLDEAIAKLRSAISKYVDDKKLLRAQKCQAQIFLLELCQQVNDKDFKNELIKTFDYAACGMATDNDLVFLGRKSHTDKYIPSSLQLFALDRFIHYAEDIQDDPSIGRKYKRAKYLAERIRMSIVLADRFPSPTFDDPVKFSRGVFRLNTEEQLYCHYVHIGGCLYMMVHTPRTIANWFEGYIKDMQKLPSLCSVFDENGDFVVGSKVANRKPFIKTHLNGEWIPEEWTTALYIDDSAFENAASRQTAIYIWTGVLVIVLILASGGIAGQAVGRQMKLNRLKNDFIATVSHELKTPLASMRVLADTLLEGNYKDQKQATEYLHLICKENKRLSGLIDNFLTFSRMERNKQAFEMVKTSPASIARDAADAVKTKFNKGLCELKVEIGDDLPDVLADQDAMVTVLVNLLDNAHKYSYDDKHIELRVYSDDGSVCFRVSDNGIGLSQRAIKKIFKRFYQVDRSLSREAEGCGLGLSIAKFIVDAHKGSISIESKPGAGTTFTVKLPSAK